MLRRKYKRILFIDFETRSEQDVQEVGSHRYNSDPSTEVILISYAYDDEPEVVCRELPQEVIDDIESGDVMKVAQNAEFDICVCMYVLHINITLTDWYDTAYALAYYSYPRALGFAANVLGTTTKASNIEMLFFSVPIVRAKEAAKDELFAVAQPTVYNEMDDYPEETENFERYSLYDTRVLRELFHKLPELPEIEIFKMHITFEMNFNGCPFDVKFAKKILEKSEEYSKEASVIAMRDYGIKNLRSNDQVKEKLKEHGLILKSLEKKAIEGIEHPILKLRDDVMGATFSKIKSGFKRICADGRLHGEFVGNGTHTGRHASRGVQLQNWYKILSQVSTNLDLVTSYEHLKQHMRLILGYAKGATFNVADLSQIEARIVANLADCKWRMKAFADGDDIYARSAEKMFGKTLVTKADNERFYGKTYELLLQYGGGKDAVKRMKPTFYKERGEIRVSKDVNDWRSANREIVRLWYALSGAWEEATKNGIKRLQCGTTKLTFMYDGKTMRIALPSGRSLYYRSAHLIQSDYGRPEIWYLDYSRGGDHSVRTKLWGGSLLENITQALASDVMTTVMKRVKERAPYALICGTVHDEAWYLNFTKNELLPVILNAMREPMDWWKELVTNGEGETSERYMKA